MVIAILKWNIAFGFAVVFDCLIGLSMELAMASATGNQITKLAQHKWRMRLLLPFYGICISMKKQLLKQVLACIDGLNGKLILCYCNGHHNSPASVVHSEVRIQVAQNAILS